MISMSFINNGIYDPSSDIIGTTNSIMLSIIRDVEKTTKAENSIYEAI